MYENCAGKLAESKLYVLLTQKLCRLPVVEAAKIVLRAGADVVQVREKEAKDSDVLQLVRQIAEVAHDSGKLVIVNDRADIANLAGADGVHLGQEDIPPAAARRLLSPGQLLGVSTHSVAQARQAVADGADYIGVGPMFPTTTKGYSKGLGPAYLRDAASVSSVPLVAIGGITAQRVHEIIAAALGKKVIIAVSAAILAAPDIEAATAEFVAAIRKSASSVPG